MKDIYEEVFGKPKEKLKVGDVGKIHTPHTGRIW
jgi:hypothetical protein